MRIRLTEHEVTPSMVPNVVHSPVTTIRPGLKLSGNRNLRRPDLDAPLLDVGLDRRRQYLVVEAGHALAADLKVHVV